jgi:tRNA dimethylallyltransferase
MQKPLLILLVGPTAVGKTELCVRLAKYFKSEIISCDSRQFYKELAIGTAKPTPQEMDGVVHHFIDSHHVWETYSAGDFERDALHLLQNLFKNQPIVFMTGGSGLFVKAITEGLDDMPQTPTELREKLMQRLENEGIEVLAQELKKLDPTAAESLDLRNSQRVVRALEVCLATGKKFSEFHQKKATERFFSILKIGVERPREELYNRINQRMDAMLSAGLLEEVKQMLPYKNQNALQTVGYKEVFDFFEQKYDEKTMIELLKRNSRRYAKRQLTWFKNQDNFTWFHPSDFDGIKTFIENTVTK